MSWVSTTSGQAVTGGGALPPMTDVIRMASHAFYYLVIFDHHTQLPLYLGRTRRTASAGQRIVLHARDRLDDVLIHGQHRQSHWFRGAGMLKLNSIDEGRERVRAWAEAMWGVVAPTNSGRGRLDPEAGFIAEPLK